MLIQNIGVLKIFNFSIESVFVNSLKYIKLKNTSRKDSTTRVSELNSKIERIKIMANIVNAV